jgi:hypothetical protein
MGTILASVIINNARKALNDATGIRWTDAELLAWLNAGQRDLAILRPDASAVNTSFTLAAGTKQVLSASALRLLDVVRNLGADGYTPGSAIRIVDREVLDAQLPDWHTAAQSATTQHFTYDNRDPRVFYVYPPAVTGYRIEIIQSVSPADVAALTSAITLDDIYAGPLTDYVLFRAYMKDAPYAGNAQLAAQYYQAFTGTLTGKTQVDIAASPNKNAPPFNPVASGGVR